jgi:demethylmenaquinone methyltransferase / 2-methoxy-6-polyprenyl-1,4-benzoquinol methylase
LALPSTASYTDAMPPGVDSLTALPPHLPLNDYYASERDRRRFLGRVFDQTAGSYDWISSLLSLGTGELYRAYALRHGGLEPGAHVLDVATGTGLLAQAAARRVGPSGRVVGLDPSAGMLSRAKDRRRIRLSRGIAERLPFKDGSFDFLSMGYALRHVVDLASTFVEYRRVLKPGGRILILDFARPRGAVAYGVTRVFMRMIVPLLSRLFAGGKEAELLMRYCWDTVDQSVAPAVIGPALETAGFRDLRIRIWAGVFVEYAAAR